MISAFDKIADGLANEGYAVIDQFLSTTEVHDLLQIDEFKTGLLQFRKSRIGSQDSRQINESIRGDYIQWIDRHTRNPQLKVYLDRLETMVTETNRNLFLSLKDFEVHLTRYPPGTGYQRHLDQFSRDDHRKLSVILYLNESWEKRHGGELRLYLPEGPIDVLPVSGRLVCFRSDQIEHAVLPATRDRLSITGWILDQHADLRHL